MFEMFYIIFWFFAMWMVSYTLSKILRRNDTGPFDYAINFLAFFGVLIHELSHFTFCKIFGVATDGISVKYRYGGKANPHGSVKTPYPGRVTFMQGFMIAFAPLFVSTWLFFYCLNMLSVIAEPLIWFFCLFTLISLFFGAAPSKPDLEYIGKRFSDNPQYSACQLSLVFLSGILCWVIIIIADISLASDIIYYVFVGVGYFALKYGFKGIGGLSRVMQTEEPVSMNYTSCIKSPNLERSDYKGYVIEEKENILW